MTSLRVLWRAVIIVGLLWWMLFAWLGGLLGIRWLFWKCFGGDKPYRKLRNEALVRRMFEILGPTFIKLGQIIASSPGLFPQRYSEEFKKCLDRVRPFPLADLKATIAEELGKPIDEVFASFEDEVLGSASIAQVHGATLQDGSEVVVKVQRPKLDTIVDADLWWMKRGAAIVHVLFKGARLANVKGVIADFDRTIHEEIDFRQEAQNLVEFNAMMADHDITDVRAPRPIDALVTKKVLVMERFRGLKADDAEGLKAANIDAEVYLRKGLKAWLMTVSLYGFFHGDAHAGNLMMMPEGPTVGFLDFGIIGRFTDAQRQQVMRYVLAFSATDYEALADIMTEIGAVELDTKQREAFVGDLREVYGPLVEKSIQELKYEEILPQITRVAFRWGVMLPNEFLLILKQLLFFDRYAKSAAPDLNVFSDFYLVDFLFTPKAMQSGLDFNALMPLMQTIQARAQAKAKG